MQRTDNFNLIVVEGSDTVNLLTQMNPNTEIIDEQLFKNQNAGVQTATELLSGTVHAITRSIPDASMIRFTAVSRFTAGDTFTVDGVQVSALLPSGEQLPDGAFIIGSEVLCVLKGTLLTVFASGGAVALAKDAEKLGGQLPSYYGKTSDIEHALNVANSAGSLAETNRQDITELNAKLNVRYNSENDMVEIFYNGVWNEWKVANLQSFYIYKNGVEGVDIALSGYTLASGFVYVASTKNSTNINMKLKSNGTMTYIGTSNTIDLSKYNKLIVEYTVGSNAYTTELNISSITINGYVIIRTYITTTGAVFSEIGVVASKTVETDKILIKEALSIGSSADIYITNIYAE